jgi:hypothetical protein
VYKIKADYPCSGTSESVSAEEKGHCVGRVVYNVDSRGILSISKISTTISDLDYSNAAHSD